MLMKCAMGHIPSTRRMGEITTPSAMSIARTVIFRMLLEFFTCIASFHIYTKQHTSLGRESIFSSHPETRVPSQITRHKALPFYPPETTRDRSTHVLSARKNKKRKPPDMGNFRKAPIAVPTLALSKSGHRSKATPSSQPVTQAPVCSVFWVIIHPPTPDCKGELPVRPSLPATRRPAARPGTPPAPGKSS